MIDSRRILLVVDPAVSDTRVIPHSVRAVVERQADEVFVVAPLLTTRVAWLTNDDAEAVADAEQRLGAVLEQLYERHVEASGAVGGDVSIVTAIGDALVEFPADEIIVAIHVDHEQHWREQSIAEQIRAAYSQPLTELLVDADGVVSANQSERSQTCPTVAR